MQKKKIESITLFVSLVSWGSYTTETINTLPIIKKNSNWRPTFTTYALQELEYG
jgi:hypothetical protein